MVRRFRLRTPNGQSALEDGYRSPSGHAAALELIEAGKIRVKDMIAHRLGPAETGLGFQLVARAQDSLKAAIMPRDK